MAAVERLVVVVEVAEGAVHKAEGLRVGMVEEVVVAEACGRSPSTVVAEADSAYIPETDFWGFNRLI